jgi:hypothetical protein
MRPSKLGIKAYRKPLVRIRLPLVGQVKTKSLYEEYYYPLLLIFAAGLILLLKAGGMSFYDASVLGLWIGAIVFFLTQVIRYFRFKADPEAEAQDVAAPANGADVAEKKPVAAAAKQLKPKLVPAKAQPGVKDAGAIKLVPKLGQAPRQPIITGTAPPSPFIKPPK